MIPEFDDLGQLPPGVWSCTLAEAHDRLCHNERRVLLWGGLMRLLQELHAADLCYPLYLAGGFVSNKPLPDDIDLVHDLRVSLRYNQFQAWQIFQRREDIKREFGVDYCVNFPGNNDFSAFFQYIGPKMAAITEMPKNHPRGILSIWSTTWRNGLTK